jgi:hypothetical protein
MKRDFVLALAAACALFPINMLLAQTTTTSSTRLIVIDLPETKAQITTDSGLKSSQLKGQMVLAQTTDASGKVVVRLENFNIRASSVATSRGPSGRLGMTLRKGSAVTREFNNSAGTLTIDFELVLHYPLIDRIKGLQTAGNDDRMAFADILKGQYKAAFSPYLSAQSTTTLIDGWARWDLSNASLGLVSKVEVDFGVVPGRSILPGRCSTGLRKLVVQPVFVRSGPGDLEPTGRALPEFIERSQSIWNRACVSFEFRDAQFVDNENYKVLSEAEEGGLRRLYDAEDAVEVFFVESFQPQDLHGGGVTSSGGSLGAQIIVSDNNLDQNPASFNNLAHELGHALSLCHPGNAICEGRAGRHPGSPGTVICPSGLDLDNPDLQSNQNAANVSNPLLRFELNACCLRTDCANECGECPDID